MDKILYLTEVLLVTYIMKIDSLIEELNKTVLRITKYRMKANLIKETSFTRVLNRTVARWGGQQSILASILTSGHPIKTARYGPGSKLYTSGSQPFLSCGTLKIRKSSCGTLQTKKIL